MLVPPLAPSNSFTFAVHRVSNLISLKQRRRRKGLEIQPKTSELARGSNDVRGFARSPLSHDYQAFVGYDVPWLTKYILTMVCISC